MKTVFNTILVLSALLTSCATRPVYVPSDRNAASMNDSEYCVQSFNQALGKVRELLKTDEAAFPKDFVVKARQLSPEVKVSCVRELEDATGSIVDRKNYSITVEEQLQGVAKLMQSELAASKMAHYKIDSRYVIYDNILVALAAHNLSELADIDDKSFDLFFRTLKVLELKMNSK